MKKLILSIGILFTGAIAAHAQQYDGIPVNASLPKITFDSRCCDFGTIVYGGDGYRELPFVNNGTEALIISYVTTSCSCVTVEWPKAPIEPGERGILKVRYDTKRDGATSKRITIVCNTREKSKDIFLKVNVLPPHFSDTPNASGGTSGAK